MDKKIPIIAVVGPTASGKTALGIELAKKYNGEIVSADSMQIYKGLDIATAKPTAEEMKEVVHHLIGVIERNINFSVADYVELAKRTIFEIYNSSKMPIIVGGTGLYISSLLDNIQFAEIKSDPKIRNELHKQAEEYGNEYLLEKLRQVDPITAQSLHANNLIRVIRALEVYMVTGRTINEFKSESRRFESPFNQVIIGLTYSDRKILYDRINTRVDIMVKNGLVEECKEIYFKFKQDNRLDINTAGKAIGYKELIPYFENNAMLDECIEKIKLETRHYAKRQLTWFRRNERINWIMLDNFDTPIKIFDECEKIIAKYKIM